MLRFEAKAAEAEAIAAKGLQLLQHAGGGALRRRCGIVQLVRKIAGELAQRVKQQFIYWFGCVSRSTTAR